MATQPSYTAQGIADLLLKQEFLSGYGVSLPEIIRTELDGKIKSCVELGKNPVNIADRVSSILTSVDTDDSVKLNGAIDDFLGENGSPIFMDAVGLSSHYAVALVRVGEANYLFVHSNERLPISGEMEKPGYKFVQFPAGLKKNVLKGVVDKVLSLDAASVQSYLGLSHLSEFSRGDQICSGLSVIGELSYLPTQYLEGGIGTLDTIKAFLSLSVLYETGKAEESTFDYSGVVSELSSAAQKVDNFIENIINDIFTEDQIRDVLPTFFENYNQILDLIDEGDLSKFCFAQAGSLCSSDASDEDVLEGSKEIETKILDTFEQMKKAYHVILQIAPVLGIILRPDVEPVGSASLFGSVSSGSFDPLSDVESDDACCGGASGQSPELP